MQITIDAWDVVGLVGFLLVLGGLAWVHPALAVAGLGVGFIVLGIWGSRWASYRRSSADRGR